MTASMKPFIATAMIVITLSVITLSGCQHNAVTSPRGTLDADVLAALIEPQLPPPAFTEGHLIAPGVTIPDPDLWRDIRNGFSLIRHTDQKRVQQELRWLQRHPRYLPNMEPRLARHLAYIHQRVVERGLPSELALLPIVESALDPYAFSHGGAAGLWQFIPATGKRFGLERNWWYDGRRDPVAATEAALDYLESLHGRFGDWYLALAGYNAGEGNVSRAQRRGRKGAGFFELKLPRETSAYVPRLLALAQLVADPAALGVTLPQLSPDVPFLVVDTGSQMDLSVVTRVTSIDIDTLYRWNPALNQWSTPPSGPHHLLLPVDEGADAAIQIAAVPENERVEWLRVKVRSGDTLSQLAHRYRTDITSLKKANGIRGTRIAAGQSLLIPRSSSALANPVAARTQGSLYVVQSGDSLWTISRAYDVPINTLMKANHVGPKDYLRVGQKLTLPGHVQTVQQVSRPAQIRKVRYGVKKGDSLARIAGKFNVRVNDIVNWNKLKIGAYLQPGQILLLYINASATGAD
ncbi:MAG: LysM peptidoglycan-binding domain-containing protein [Pseudomonadales bacterium]